MNKQEFLQLIVPLAQAEAKEERTQAQALYFLVCVSDRQR